MKQLIIGAGNMAKALLPSYIKLSGSKFYCYTPSGTTAESFAKTYGINTFILSSTCEVFDVVWLTMKPQQIVDVADKFKANIGKNTIVISLLAGVPCEKIQKLFGTNQVLRIMPNTPSLVQEGVNALYVTEAVSKKFFEEFLSHFSGSGRVFKFDEEEKIDIITPYSGSGPAYFFEINRVLIDKMVSQGIKQDVATEMVAATMKGAAQMILESDLSPLELRNNVTSKGGVTACALNVLKEENLELILNKAIDKAFEKTIELKG